MAYRLAHLTPLSGSLYCRSASRQPIHLLNWHQRDSAATPLWLLMDGWEGLVGWSWWMCSLAASCYGVWKSCLQLPPGKSNNFLTQLGIKACEMLSTLQDVLMEFFTLFDIVHDFQGPCIVRSVSGNLWSWLFG